MATWLHLPDEIPTDAQTVWVRVEYYYSEPFLAIFSLSALTFTSVTNSIVYPAWVVARWKP
jgi:hypothetical protein